MQRFSKRLISLISILAIFTPHIVFYGLKWVLSLLSAYFPKFATEFSTSLRVIICILAPWGLILGIWLLLHPKKLKPKIRYSHFINLELHKSVLNRYDDYELEEWLKYDPSLILDGSDDTKIFFDTNFPNDAVKHIKIVMNQLNIHEKLYSITIKEYPEAENALPTS